MQRGFEVEWTVDVPYNAAMDCHEHDMADTRCRDFASKDDALKFAESKVKDDWYGAPVINEFKLNRWKQKDYVGDAVEVSA